MSEGDTALDSIVAVQVPARCNKASLFALGARVVAGEFADYQMIEGALIRRGNES